MKIQLKPLDQQVVVITGASSGIGLATARMAAGRGAKVVLAARSAQGLQQTAQRVEAEGGRALAVEADVSDPREVERVAERAVATFGGIDTWINNAGVSVYGRIEEMSVEDMRRVLDVNFWGVVHGSRAAIPHLRRHGGALINVGCALSDRAIPLQGIYSASKHAVKGLTDSLRMELEHEGAPVSVTLVKPASIDTPLFQHAKSYMDVEPAPAPPVYTPEVVAQAILHCATHPVRDVLVGGGAKAISSLGLQTPRLADLYQERTQFRQQRGDRPARPADNLFAPIDRFFRTRGHYPGHVMRSSAYTRFALSSRRARALTVLGVGLALVAGLRALRAEDFVDDEDLEPEFI